MVEKISKVRWGVKMRGNTKRKPDRACVQMEMFIWKGRERSWKKSTVVPGA